MSLETLTDLCTPWCMHVVATLRIAHHIHAGTERIEELANAAQCDQDVLHCIMGHLVVKGVFEETEPGRFLLNEEARGLLEMDFLNLDGFGGRMAHAWGTLLDFARTGKPAYDKVFGMPFWEDLNAHPGIGAEFDALMGPAGHGTPSADIEITGGWESVRSVMDVGGGTGAMLAEVLKRHAHLKGTLLDQPRTVAHAHTTFDEAGVADRVTIVGQSFFDELPAGSDLYILRGILNDWPDEETRAILKRCADAARPNGRVLVLKGLRSETEPKRLMIEMVLAGGKHRTVNELAALAKQSGLELLSAGPQPRGYFTAEFRPL